MDRVSASSKGVDTDSSEDRLSEGAVDQVSASPAAASAHLLEDADPVRVVERSVKMDKAQHVIRVEPVADGQSTEVKIGTKPQESKTKPLKHKLEKQQALESHKKDGVNEPVQAVLTHTLGLVTAVQSSSDPGEWRSSADGIAHDLENLGNFHHIRMLGKAPAPTSEMALKLRERNDQRLSEDASQSEDSTTMLGSAFHDKPAGGRDPAKDACLEADVELRLEALNLRGVVEGGAGLEFKHWMVEGEMPPPYLEPLHRTFGRMGVPYQQAFLMKARKMRAATAITRALTEQYELFLANATDSERASIDEGLQDRATISGWPLNPESLSDNRLQLIEARTERLEKAGMKLESLLTGDKAFISGRIDKWVKGGKKATLAAVGDAMWELCSLNLRGDQASAELNDQIKDAKKTVGQVLMSYGGKLANTIKENEGAVGAAKESQDVDAIQQAEAALQEAKTAAGHFAFLGQGWSEATSALGEDVFGEVITDSYSAVVADYFGEHEVVDEEGQFTVKRTGEDMVNESMQRAKDDGKNAWCDMDIPASMWSRGANLDRYRDTDVHLFKGTGGAKVSREQDDFDLRVTHQEVQVGSSFDAVDVMGNTVPLDDAFQINDEDTLARPRRKPKEPEAVRVLQNGHVLYDDGSVVDREGNRVPPSGH